MTQPMRPAEYNPFPYPKRRAKEPGAPLVGLTRPEEALRRDLRALEAVQASRPMKPPTKR